MSSEQEKDGGMEGQNASGGGLEPAGEVLPTLSDLLIGFQKSMARVAQATARATREDPLFLYGRRNLYYIDEVDVEAIVHIRPDEDAEAGGKRNFENIRVLTEEQAQEVRGEPRAGWTRLKFKLVGRTLDERLQEPAIFIRLEKYRKKERDYLLELQVMDEAGMPTVCRNITVEVLPEGDEKRKKSLSDLATNEMGFLHLRLAFKRDPKVRKKENVILTDGKAESPKIADAPTYMIRAFASGKDFKAGVEKEVVRSFASLVIHRSEHEEG